MTEAEHPVDGSYIGLTLVAVSMMCVGLAASLQSRWWMMFSAYAIAMVAAASLFWYEMYLREQELAYEIEARGDD